MWRETTTLANVLKTLFAADKMNVATLGLAIKSFQLLYSYATKSTLYAALWQLCVVSDMLCMLFFMSETAKLTADPLLKLPI